MAVGDQTVDDANVGDETVVVPIAVDANVVGANVVLPIAVDANNVVVPIAVDANVGHANVVVPIAVDANVVHEGEISGGEDYDFIDGEWHYMPEVLENGHRPMLLADRMLVASWEEEEWFGQTQNGKGGKDDEGKDGKGKYGKDDEGNDGKGKYGGKGKQGKDGKGKYGKGDDEGKDGKGRSRSRTH